MTERHDVGTSEGPLTTAQHVENLTVEGRRLGEVVAAASFTAPVPGCPGWTVERLVRHIGDVHRWAAMIVRERVQERLRFDFTGPGSEALLDWYAEGHNELLAALAGASPEDEFWAWAPAPNALAFWARRQAHETAIHRLDAEQAANAVTPFAPAQAADGIDEWLSLAARRLRSTTGDGRTLHIGAVDGPWQWVVSLEPDGLSVRPGPGKADCSARGAASDLFALAMNRGRAPDLVVDGDGDVLLAWRESVHF